MTANKKQRGGSGILIVMALVLLAGDTALAYESRGRRDPFLGLIATDGSLLPGAEAATAVAVEEERVHVRLEGIFFEPDGSSIALINGALLKERDRLGPLQLLTIKRDRVIVQQKGEVREFLLKERGK